jgi:hypothetical protein
LRSILFSNEGEALWRRFEHFMDITLEHNTSSPQPYDRIDLIAGTKGIFRDDKFEHKYWTEVGDMAYRPISTSTTQGGARTRACSVHTRLNALRNFALRLTPPQGTQS